MPAAATVIAANNHLAGNATTLMTTATRSDHTQGSDIANHKGNRKR